MAMKKMLAVAAAAALVALSAPAFANPFSDVPQGSWAYDAVDQLAARGIITGYPDGTFKGNQPITRYEMAALIARAMATVEVGEGLSNEDMEVLKRLMVEFKDELDALGVRVDDMDNRLAGLEENLGGWKFWGDLQFDALWSTEDSANNQNIVDEYYLYIQKQVTDNITFTTRLASDDDTGQAIAFDLFWMDINDFMGGFDFTVGRWEFDWEDEDGLYIDNDSIMGDTAIRGFMVSRAWSNFSFAALIGQDSDTSGPNPSGAVTGDDQDVYGARFRFDFNERFFLSLNMLAYDAQFMSYWGALGYNFADGLALKGVYYGQDLKEAARIIDGEDDPQAFRVILDVDQDVLKFTSLWVEYGKYDKGFQVSHFDPFNFTTGDNGLFSQYESEGDGGYAANDVEMFFVSLTQQWTEKWSTFERYLHASGASFEGVGDDTDVDNWTVGVGYQYSPNLYFELAYDDIKGDGTGGNDDYRDRLIRFRTRIDF